MTNIVTKKTKLQNTPKRKTEVWGFMDDDCVEISRENKTNKLDPIESYIWERCNGRVTIGEMINDLAKKNNAGDNLENLKTGVSEILESWKCDDLLIMNYNSLNSASEYDDSCIYHIEANVPPPVDILFLSPPSPSPSAHRGLKQEPLGIGYLSAFLRSHGFCAGVMDLWVEQLNPRTVIDFITRYNPKIVGISSMTVNFENGIRIAEIIKELSGDTIILFGGCHVTFKDEETLLQHKSIDIIVRGEGEYTVLELAKYFLDNIGELSDIQGITYRKDSKIMRTQDRAFVCDLDSLPFPDRINLRKDFLTGIQTSRGCPAQCIFCSAGGLAGGKYRQRSAENVVSEIELLLSQGIDFIFFQDDTLTVDLKRLNKILDLIEKKGLSFKWSAESRVEAIGKDPNIVKRMINAGCTTINFGVESGSQAVLDALKKNITIKQVYDAVTLVGKEGIDLRCSFLIGHPFETYDTMLETLKFAKELVDLGAIPMISAVCPFPGTSISKRPEFFKVKIHNYDYSNYTTQVPIMDTQYLTAKEIKKYHYNHLLELNRHLKGHKMWHFMQRALSRSNDPLV